MSNILSPRKEKILNFSIIGTKGYIPSSIRCSGRGGIFIESEPNKESGITLMNLILNNCSTGGIKHAALTLVAIKDYYLFNVTTKNSLHSGIFSDRCHRHVIASCTFEDSSASHIKIRFTNLQY